MSLGRWFRAQGRHGLPWRLDSRPWPVLVSEVMLQQTQVARVIPYFTGWMAAWPTPLALARAPLAEALMAWGGLGHNRRAVQLHRAAREIGERFRGEVPLEPAALRSLPGLGEYTAAAVACFAADAPVAVLDTNVQRVVSRAILGRAGARDCAPSEVRAAAAAAVPASGARDHNLALMDLGALVCRAREPSCAGCPLRTACRWQAAGLPPGPARPVRSPVRFEDSARFARGRIVAALRGQGPLEAEALAELLPGGHRALASAYLEALERDGLVERAGGSWRLAGMADYRRG